VHYTQPSQQLYLFSDASKVSTSQILFAKLPDGDLQVVGANSSLFNYLDSMRSSFTKEAISLAQGMTIDHL